MKILVLLIVFLAAETEAYRGYYKKWKPRRPICDPIKCEENCREVAVEGDCPKCVCEPLCSEPECPKGCELKMEFNGPCPGCDCSGEEAFKDIIEPRIFDQKIPLEEKDVPKEKCSPPKCPPGCEIEVDFIGPCPGCKCDESDYPDPVKPVQCLPPKCAPGCEIVEELDGPCPGCKCDKEDIPEPVKPIECSPPKCPPGCEIEKEFFSPCPGCKCDKDDVPEPEPKGCDPVKCSPGCREEQDPKGCPTCVCDIKCDPPKCGPGCELELEPKGMCPECICKDIKDDLPPVKVDEEKKDCPIIDDCSKPGCEKKVDEKGCDICECKPICDPPKCPRRCKIDNSGECPKCVCKKFRWGR